MPPLSVCEPRTCVSVVDELKRAHAARVVREVGVRASPTLRKAKGRLGSGDGVAKVKKYLLRPKIASFVRVGVGDQRQLTARFFGVRDVSTKFGVSGKIGRPRIRRITKGALASLRITNIEQTVVAQVEVKLADEVVLLFMLRRSEIKSRRIQTIADGEIVRQRHRVDKPARASGRDRFRLD